MGWTRGHVFRIFDSRHSVLTPSTEVYNDEAMITVVIILQLRKEGKIQKPVLTNFSSLFPAQLHEVNVNMLIFFIAVFKTKINIMTDRVSHHLHEQSTWYALRIVRSKHVWKPPLFSNWCLIIALKYDICKGMLSWGRILWGRAILGLF